MEALIRVSNKLTIKVDGTDTKTLFEKIAQAGETFGVSKCGCCGGEDLSFRVRENQNYKFYELVCLARDCRARLEFGQSKEGALYPRRKDKEGNWLDNNGWSRWTGQTGQQQQSRQASGEEREF